MKYPANRESAKYQIAINVLFVALRGGSMIAVLWVADLFLAASTMGFLLLFKKQGTLWANFIQLGFSQSLRRYYIIADNSYERESIWSAHTNWVVIASALFILITFMMPSTISIYLFGEDSSYLSFAFGIFVAGIAIGYMACSSWMAEFQFIAANITEWFMGSLIFGLCIVIFGELLPKDQLSLLLGILTLFITCVSLLYFARYHSSLRSFCNKGCLNIPRPMYLYGGSRMLSSFSDLGTWVVGPWLLRSHPVDAGYLIIAYSVLSIIQGMISPIGQVLALRANSYRYNSAQETGRVFILGLSVFLGSFLVVFAYWCFGDWLIALWLPNSHEQVAAIVSKLIIFLPAYCLFYTLRSFIDMRYSFPWILLVFGLSILAILGMSIFGSGISPMDNVIMGSQMALFIFLVCGISAMIALRGTMRTTRSQQ